MDSDENRQSVNNIHRNNNTEIQSPQSTSKRNIWLGVAAVVLTIGIGATAWWLISDAGASTEENIDEAAAKQLELEEQLAASELENAEKELTMLEDQRNLALNDSVKLRLTQQYESARLQIDRLQAQLKDSKKRSQKEIEDLRGEISRLRELLKHYLEEIARLNKENEQLRSEISQVRDENSQLSSQVQSTTAQNKVLNERMTLAEKMNVTGVSLTALNGKDKPEKKVKKSHKLMVTFTIPQNNSTPVGEKTIYLRIISPEGNLLGGAGSFSFEDTSVPCSAKRVIEYEGSELAGIHIYCDNLSGLTAGEYTVELFADNYRLIRKSFTLK